MRDQIQKCFCGKPGMKLSLAPFDRDERVLETERILELLIESRFGPGRPYLHFADSYDTESMADNVIYDLMPAGPFPLMAEAQCADSILDRKQDANSGMHHNFAATFTKQHDSPSTLARGSPFASRLSLL